MVGQTTALCSSIPGCGNACPHRRGHWVLHRCRLGKGVKRRAPSTTFTAKSWRAPAVGQPGGQRICANIAIETPLTIRMVFHLPLRQTEGFLRSLAEKLELIIAIPDHTTLSRRVKKLGKIPFYADNGNRPMHLLTDSTGLRIHVGNPRKPPKRRAWRKLHLAVDAATGEIVASDLTSRRTHDCVRVPVLLEQIDSRVDPLIALRADRIGVQGRQRRQRAAEIFLPASGGSLHSEGIRAAGSMGFRNWGRKISHSIFGQFRSVFDALCRKQSALG